jgi:hypothetical protein
MHQWHRMNPLSTHTRKTLALPDAMWVEIARFRHARCIGTEVEAVRRLIDAGLKAESQRTRRKGKKASDE